MWKAKCQAIKSKQVDSQFIRWKLEQDIHKLFRKEVCIFESVYLGNLCHGPLYVKCDHGMKVEKHRWRDTGHPVHRKE